MLSEESNLLLSFLKCRNVGMVWYGLLGFVCSPQKGHSCDTKNYSRRDITKLTLPKKQGPNDNSQLVTTGNRSERGLGTIPIKVGRAKTCGRI